MKLPNTRINSFYPFQFKMINQERSSKHDILSFYKTKLSQAEKPSCLFNFGSRGSLMLQAALSEKREENNQRSIKQNHNQQQPNQEQQRQQQLRQLRLKQRLIRHGTDSRQVKLLKLKRNLGTPVKARVLFAEPLVSAQFEYEQTTLSDAIIGSPTSNNENTNLSQTNETEAPPTSGVHNLEEPLKNDSNNNEFSTPKKRSLKRKRPIELPGGNPIASSEEGLFSSPKVAKIAPYYHFELEKLASELKEARFNYDKVNPLDTITTPIETFSAPLEEASLRSGSPSEHKPSGLAGFFNSFQPTRVYQWFSQLLPNYNDFNLVR